MHQDLKNGWDFFETSDARTKMRILRGIDKSLDVMKVADICQNAGISRRTFYRHFDNKFEIPGWYFTYCAKYFLNEVGRSIGWRTGYYHHLRLLTQESSVLHKALRYSINDPFQSSSVSQERAAVLMDTLVHYRKVEVDDNLRFLVETFAKLEWEIVCDRLRSDPTADLMRWTEDIVSMIPPRLYQALQLGSEEADYELKTYAYA